jgi:undecaprenyl-diphosphatase
MQTFDIQLFFLINRGTANPLFDFFMPLLTHQGYLLIIPLLPYLIYCGVITRDSDGRRHLVTALAVIVIAFISFPLAETVGDHVKVLTARPRPCHVLAGVRLLVTCSATFSLPSNHAVTSFAVATPLFLLTKDFVPLHWRLYPVLLAVLIAYSRPYVGVHYVSDIAAGAGIGAAVGAFFCWLFRWIEGRRKRPTETEGQKTPTSS